MLVIFICFALSSVTLTISALHAGPIIPIDEANFKLAAQVEAQTLELKYLSEVKVTDSSNSQFAISKREPLHQNRATALPPSPSVRQVGYTVVKNDKNNTWSNDLTIFGNPPISALVDTGSSISIFTKSAYTPSPLAIRLGKQVGINYLDGKAARGEVYLDYITIAGITLRSEIVWAETDFLDPSKSAFQAVVGFGFPQNPLAPSLMEEMVSQNSLLTDTISYTMTGGNNGAMYLGALDSSAINEIKYTNVDRTLGSRWHTTLAINGHASIPT
ncbi:hypothetical protein CBS101457_003815 [Exobasidium rhododendri]|nr:hypothetical protein CBS101457_003815 [Exobasidium rhododendri]